MADYVLEGPSWGTDPVVTWSIAESNYPAQQLDFSSFLSADYASDIEAAFAKWASVADVTFQEVPDSAASDIRLGLNPIDGPWNTVGLTSIEWTSSLGGTAQNLVAADIEFDSDEGWTKQNGHMVSNTGVDLYPVALHEIGHALGLDHYTGGPAIMNPSVSVGDLTQSDIDGIQALYGPSGSGSGSIAGAQNAGPTYVSSSMDVFHNQRQASATFVFNPGFGHDIVGGFVVAGAGHSTLDLPASDFASVADVLRHTQAAGHGSLISDPVSGDTIRLVAISKSELVRHHGDFTFHA